MKKFITIFSALLLLSACKTDTAKTMTVTGNVKGLKKGTLYLQHVPDSVLIDVDSIVVNGDGNFTFTTTLESPEIFYLYLDKKDNNTVNDRITFFGEPGTVSIHTDLVSFDSDAKISGSLSNEKLEEYRKVMSSINKRNLELMLLAGKQDGMAQERLDSLSKESERNIKKGYAYAINFALNNKDSYIAPYIALKEIPDANKKFLDSIYAVLTPEVTNSKYGLALKEHLKNLK